MSFIGRLQPASRPGLPTWVVGTIDALNALTEVAPGMPITSDDIGRVAQVGSSSPSFYILTGVSPNTWVIFGGPQGGLAAMDQVTAQEINSGTAVPGAVATAQGDGSVKWEWASALVGKFTVLSRTTTAQPSSPTDGDRYIVPASATGADWAGQDGNVALYQDGAWSFYQPANGWSAYVVDADERVAYNAASGWQVADTLTAAQRTKLGYISVTNAVDLDSVVTQLNGLSSAVVLEGGWDASTGAFPSGASQGYTYIVTAAGTVDGVDFQKNDRLLALVDGPSTTTYSGNWLHLDYTDQVLTVAGRTGNVVLSMADITDAGAVAALDKITAANIDSSTAAAGAVATAQGDGTVIFATPATPGGCLRHSSVNVNIPNATLVYIDVDQEVFSDGNYSYDTSAKTITVPKDGLYLVAFSADLSQASGNGIANLRCMVNTTIAVLAASPVQNGQATQLAYSGFAYCKAGDQLSFAIYQNSGGSLTARGGSNQYTLNFGVSLQ